MGEGVRLSKKAKATSENERNPIRVIVDRTRETVVSTVIRRGTNRSGAGISRPGAIRENAAHGLGSKIVVIRHEVSIGVQGDSDIGMTETLADLLDRDTGPEHQ